jgi:spore coat polysaccharide biosynthesis protein SpsF
VLIHVSPQKLGTVYEKLYSVSRRYILVCEYYNPSPVSVTYRGDFAGELLDRYADLALIDYGFVYSRDPAFPQDDITWFLMEKKS